MFGGRGRARGGGRVIAGGSSGPWRQWSNGRGRGSSGPEPEPPSYSCHSWQWSTGRGGMGSSRPAPKPAWQRGRGRRGGTGSRSNWQWSPSGGWKWEKSSIEYQITERPPMPGVGSHSHTRNFGDFDPVRNAEMLNRSTPRELLSRLELDRQVVLVGPSSPPSTSPFQGPSGTQMKRKQGQPQSGNSHSHGHGWQEEEDVDDFDVEEEEEVQFVGIGIRSIPPGASSHFGEPVVKKEKLDPDNQQWSGMNGFNSDDQTQRNFPQATRVGNYNYAPLPVPPPSMNQPFQRPPPIFLPLRTGKPSCDQYNPVDSDEDSSGEPMKKQEFGRGQQQWGGCNSSDQGQAQGQPWGTRLPNNSQGTGAWNYAPLPVPRPSINQPYNRPPPVFVSSNQHNPDGYNSGDDGEDQTYGYGSGAGPQSFHRTPAQRPSAASPSTAGQAGAAQKNPSHRQSDFNSNSRIPRASRAEEDSKFRVTIHREDPNDPPKRGPVRKTSWNIDYNRPGFY